MSNVECRKSTLRSQFMLVCLLNVESRMSKLIALLFFCDGLSNVESRKSKLIVLLMLGSM